VSSETRRAAAVLAALALIVAAHAFLLTRLNDRATYFDEGVFLASLAELQHDQALGRDVFASQMPGFYLLLEAIGAAVPVTVEGVRAGFAAVTTLGAVFAFLLGRRLSGALGGLLMAALVVSAPVLPLVGGLVFADPAAMVLTLAALWLAASRRPALAGALFAAAMLVKLSVLTAAPTLVVLLVWHGPWRQVLPRFAAGAAVVVAATALLFARDLGALWEGAVSYHLEAGDIAGIDGADKLRAFFDYTTPYFWFVVAGALATAATWRRVWPLWLWPALAAVFVLRFQPLRDNQLVLLPYSFAVPTAVALGLAARRLSPRLLVAVVVGASVALTAGWIQQRNRLQIEPRPEDAGLVQAAREVRGLTGPDDLVIADQPIVAFLADRRTPGELVDTSSLRFQTGSLTDSQVLATIDGDPRVKVVVAGRAFVPRAALMAGLRERFRERRVGPSAVVFSGRR
jgi:hypothetical protein